jgi:hypothetical protein
MRRRRGPFGCDVATFTASTYGSRRPRVMQPTSTIGLVCLPSQVADVPGARDGSVAAARGLLRQVHDNSRGETAVLPARVCWRASPHLDDLAIIPCTAAISPRVESAELTLKNGADHWPGGAAAVAGRIDARLLGTSCNVNSAVSTRLVAILERAQRMAAPPAGAQTPSTRETVGSRSIELAQSAEDAPNLPPTQWHELWPGPRCG